MFHDQTIRDALAQDVLDAVDGGSSFGTFCILDGSDVLLAQITFQKPSSIRTGAVLAYQGLPLSVVAATTGTSATAEIRDSDGVPIYGGSCGIAGSGPGGADPDFIIDNSAIVAGQLVSLISHSYESMD